MRCLIFFFFNGSQAWLRHAVGDARYSQGLSGVVEVGPVLPAPALGWLRFVSPWVYFCSCATSCLVLDAFRCYQVAGRSSPSANLLLLNGNESRQQITELVGVVCKTRGLALSRSLNASLMEPCLVLLSFYPSYATLGSLAST